MKGLIFARESLGLTQTQLAEYFNIPRGSLSMIEAGRRELPLELNPKYDVLRLAAEKTDATIANSDAGASLAWREEDKQFLQTAREAYIANCRRVIFRLEQRQKRLDKNLARTRRLEIAFSELLNALPADAEYERLWVSAQSRLSVSKRRAMLEERQQIDFELYAARVTLEAIVSR